VFWRSVLNVADDIEKLLEVWMHVSNKIYYILKKNYEILKLI